MDVNKKNKCPGVSIIIPTYNRENTIKNSLDSVINQDYEGVMEILVIDDYSSDNTCEIIKRFYGDKVKLICLKENRGACYARNKGISLAQNQYIAFQDSDDQWYKDKLRVQMNTLLKVKADIVSCKMTKHHGGKSEIVPPYHVKDEDLMDRLFVYNFIGTPTILGRKECFEDCKFDIRYKRFQDWELILKLLCKYKVHFINESLMDSYIQEDSLTKNPRAAIESLHMLMDEYKDYLSKHKYQNKMMLKKLGLFSIQANEFKHNYYIDAWKLSPLDIKVICHVIRFQVIKMKIEGNKNV